MPRVYEKRFYGTHSKEWQFQFAHDRFSHPGFRQCTALSRRTGERCKSWAVGDGDRCRMHDGNSVATPRRRKELRKIQAMQAKTQAKYASSIPPGLSERYHEALERDDLTTLSSELALFDVRIADLLARLGKGESSDLWDSLRDSWTQFMMAVRVGDSETQNSLLSVLNRLITQGHTVSAQWDELAAMIEKRRKLVETENKRIASSRDTITVQQAVLMLQMVIEATRLATLRYADKKTAQAILTDAQNTYTQLLSAGRDSGSNPTVVDGEYSPR